MATVTRAEFELLREELRETHQSLRALENKLWGIVAAVALIAAGALFHSSPSVPHIDTGTAALIGVLGIDSARTLLAYWR